MRKPATVKAVLASLSSFFDEFTISKVPPLPIKCKARRDGRRLAAILNNMSLEMDSFHRLYDAYRLKYPFHRDELQKAFWKAL